MTFKPKDWIPEEPFEFGEARDLEYEGEDSYAMEDDFDEAAFEQALSQEREARGLDDDELDLSMIVKFDPLKHPRNVLTGRFIDTPDSLDIEGDSHRYRSVVGGHHKIEVGEDVAIGASKHDAIEKARELKAKQRAEREILGKTSPESLIREARRRILSGHPTTVDKYSYTDPNTGERVYDESRKQVHDDIVDAFLRMDANGDPCESCPYHTPPEDRAPQVFFSGGGFASGKGRVVNTHPDVPESAITLDPDKIKAMLPEFKELNAAKDEEANLRVYEEAWDIAQLIAHRIQSEGLDVVVDGVGNTSSDEMLERVQQYLDAGYEAPKAVYVSIPTDLAVERAQSRAAQALESGKTESLRVIPEDLMRDVHGDVSKVFPDIAESFPGAVELWDNSGEEPVQVVQKADGGQLEILDEELWQAFLSKAQDSKE